MRFFSKVYSVVEILHQRNRGLNAKILRGGASHQDLRGVHTIFFTTSASALTAPGHTQCRSKGNVYQQWCEHASLPHALLYAEPVRPFAVIRPDARSYSRITASISRGTTNRARTVHKRVRSTESHESYAWLFSEEVNEAQVNRGVFFFGPVSW